jgi:hypothetical protein
MGNRIPTIGFWAKSVPHWRRILTDTAIGICGFRPDHLPAWCHNYARVRWAFTEEYRVLSYVLDWKDAFSSSPQLDLQWYNINNLLEFRAGLKQLTSAPFCVILHSAAGDNISLLQRAVGYFQARRGKVLVCFGNEYREMPQKIRFAKSAGVDYIASQLPLAAARWLYADCKAGQVLCAPPGLNSSIYRPVTGSRPIDIGFRGQLYEHAFTLGDQERFTVLRRFEESRESWGLTKDIRYERQSREEWSDFLNQCRGIIGAESGTYFLERDDHTRLAVLEHMEHHPTATFQDVYDRFFRDYPYPVSGKAISSRHFEPIGTKTCQLLLEGNYNGILKADEHYISIKKDFSNIEDAVARFKDEDYRSTVVTRAYEYVLAGHTYDHRVEDLLKAIFGYGLAEHGRKSGTN